MGSLPRVYQDLEVVGWKQSLGAEWAGMLHYKRATGSVHQYNQCNYRTYRRHHIGISAL
ncbi:hypothetical protein PAXRUDRAFT_835554 [Paxillus rubicundulus Ve08.2h10]|uniref:Uncharacterized protein n=1 Tax=Paxillus rubicundulus Ve08.2h10 TaxID=930991 RepID=A0A0D0DE71_9AGAM|nr:hypothetical protein PAXRUDRAFT_835554 [Paxillus rubicundulus Ve08.2h10]